MKPFIVVSDGFDKDLFNQLKNINEFETHPKAKLSLDELNTLLPKINGLIVRSATQVNQELINKAPNLKLVIRAGAGTDNIDIKSCNEKGIKVSNTPGANSNSAAEQAIALMMAVLRKTAWAHSSMKTGKWEKARFSGSELWKKKIGLVGFGKIAQIVAKRISGFEPVIKYFDPYVETSEISYASKEHDIKKIFSESDIVSLHLPLMEETKNMVNSDLLNLMKPDAILINASRGGIVNEDDLYSILKEERIKGAGFDVYASEPIDPNSKLLKLDNIVLTPHLGASTKEAQIRVGEMALHQIKEFFINNNLLNEVKN